MTIVKLLDVLAQRREALACVEAEIAQAIPPELAQRREVLTADVGELEKTVKEKAKYIPPSQAHTLVGKVLQLVWTPGGKKIDEERLKEVFARYGVSAEDAMSVWTPREGYWSIRKRGK